MSYNAEVAAKKAVGLITSVKVQPAAAAIILNGGVTATTLLLGGQLPFGVMPSPTTPTLVEWMDRRRLVLFATFSPLCASVCVKSGFLALIFCRRGGVWQPRRRRRTSFT
jgi:hypothetical protein